MINYWYLSLSNEYPKPNKEVKCVWLMKEYTVIEMTSEASEKEIDKCKLVYLGRGRWDDEHIQNNYEKYHDLIIWGR